MFAIKAPVVKVVAAAQNQKSEKKAMCVFASTRSTLDFEFRFFIIFVPRKRERELYNRNWERKAFRAQKKEKNEEGEEEILKRRKKMRSLFLVRKTRSV
jgi:hypothetical protein